MQEEIMVHYTKENIPLKWVFQQDSDLKHNS